MSASGEVSHTAGLLDDKLKLEPTHSQTAITQRDLHLPYNSKKLAFVLENVLTKEECDAYIKKTEKMGYELALLNMGLDRQELRTDVRNSSRCIWDSPKEADKIWRRIEPFIPKDFEPGFQLVGLNERLRFLRYDPGEYFKPHFDGSYTRTNGERSYITVQLYLNEGFEGGNTTFFGAGLTQPCAVVPKIGSVLVFQHNMLHEGSILVKGRKYSMRTDIMFKPLSKQGSQRLPTIALTAA